MPPIARVPVATSALLQVPMVARILPKGKRPAILTFSAESLTTRHLEAVGVDPATPVHGMPPGSEFQRAIREGDASVPFATLQREVLEAAESHRCGRTPASARSVLECTNLAPYSRDIARLTGLPVFDMVTLVHWFHRSLSARALRAGLSGSHPAAALTGLPRGAQPSARLLSPDVET